MREFMRRKRRERRALGKQRKKRQKRRWVRGEALEYVASRKVAWSHGRMGACMHGYMGAGAKG